MAKNPAIGEITCPFTGTKSDVCRAKTGKFPLYYRNTSVGIIHGKAPAFQEWILENATMFGAKPAEEKPTEEPPREEVPVKSKSWIDEFFGGDDE
jgi:hypothetical protein